MLLYSPCFACIIILKPAACSVRIAMILHRYIECVTSHNRKNCFGSCCEGVASEGRVVSVPNFHSLGKSTMPLANINSDWMSNTSSGLCIVYYVGPLLYILRCNFSDYPSSFLPQVLRTSKSSEGPVSYISYIVWLYCIEAIHQVSLETCIYYTKIIANSV